MHLRIGTSGWNYPTGRGTWNGIFYPLPEDRQKGFDELAFYAERFNVVEVTTLKKMLDEPVTAPMPAELVERFPDLEGVATLPRARLL